MIPRFILALLNGQNPSIYGDGEQSRDFTFVENVVEANLKASRIESIAGEIINIACNQRYSLNQLWNTLNRIAGMKLAPVFTDPKPGDIRHSLADIDKANKLLDYRVIIGFEEGLKRTFDYYRELKS